MQRLRLAEERHFWHQARNELIASSLARLGVLPPARVLDLGCGGGCVTAFLARLGYSLTGVDGHLSRVLDAARRAPGASFLVHDVRGGLQGVGAPFDAVGLFDVIEHLDEPTAALQQALSITRPGGVVVGTVPALMALWSDADVLAGHHLRYDLHTLRQVLQRVEGAEKIEVRWFNRLLVLPTWWARRVRSATSEQGNESLTVPQEPLNRALLTALRWEQGLFAKRSSSRIPGASLWFSLRKQA